MTANKIAASADASNGGDNRATLPEEASPDDLLGVAWFNGISEFARAYWLAQAGSARPSDAWTAYKRKQEVAGRAE